MNQFIKKLWQGWKRAGIFIGNIISSVFLFIFYYTIFAVFALPFKFFEWKKNRASNHSYFSPPAKQFSNLEDFKNEF